MIPKFLVEDLHIWKKCIVSAKKGLPLSEPQCNPPIIAIKFISDAAGAAFHWSKCHCKNLTLPNDRGVASVGFQKDDPFFAGLKWPFAFLTKHTDCKNRLWGGKSGALECIGLLIPFLTKPSILMNKFIVLLVRIHSPAFFFKCQPIAKIQNANYRKIFYDLLKYFQNAPIFMTI